MKSRSSPTSPGRPRAKMGHAGAIISSGAGTAESKKDALISAGVKVAASLEEAYDMLEEILHGNGYVPSTPDIANLRPTNERKPS